MSPSNPIIIPLKPSRPFTEYHIFFQLERNYILQTSDKSSEVDTTVEFSEIDLNASTRPPRYRSLTLPKHWHTKGSRPKCRSHRKNHGKISFVELTKLISQRWRAADQVTRGYCRDLAQRGLKRYREDMKEYVERFGEEAIHMAKVGKKEEKKQTSKQKQEKLVQDNINFLLKDQAVTMLAPQAQALQVHLPSYQDFSQFYARGLGVQPQPQQQSFQQLHQQQQQHCLKNYQNQLEMCRLQNQMNNIMKMQSQAQAMNNQEVSHVMMPQVNANQGQYGMMDSCQFNDHANMNKMTNMTTVKDQGQLPSLFEDQEYSDFPTNNDGECYVFPTKNDGYDNRVIDYNNQYPPQGPNQGNFDDDFRSFDGKTDELPAASYDDYAIVGPMGICPKSPTTSPPRLNAKANEEPDTPRTPGGNMDIRAKSISPMPEYNIAPEISFLAKNFVNQFSRYLNHDHEVQNSELDAINIDNNQAGVLDHQGMEKQALNSMFNGAPNDSVGTHEKGMQEMKSDDAPRGNGFSVIGNYPNAFLGFESDLCKPIKNNGVVNKGYSLDMSKPNNHSFKAAPSVYEFSKPARGQQQMPAYAPPHGVHNTMKQFEGSSADDSSCDISQGDMQAWLSEYLD